MEELVKFIVENLVKDKQAVSVSTTQDGENSYVIKVSVAKEDMGKVIGKGGKIASSIRSIVKTACNAKGDKAHYYVKFE